MTPHFSPEPDSPVAQPFTPSPHRVPDLRGAPILLVGPGAMGSAIAERAALAGHPVLWRDGRDGIAAAAKARLAHRLAAQVGRGERDAGAVAEALARIEPISDLGRASGVRLVIEAVVEHAEIKRGLLRNLEDWVGADCVFATTTATLSISALASGLRQPPRLAGLHFGLPALAGASGSSGSPPTSDLVEVVSGLQTDAAVAVALAELVRAWGQTPVQARSGPGFVVDRIAAPYTAEALALLQVQATTPTVLDACLRAAGFRAGPCEWMDARGHDTALAERRAFWDASFGAPRWRPSPLQRELVDAGWLGVKTGQGFYDHRSGAARPAIDAHTAADWPQPRLLRVHGQGPVALRLAAQLASAGRVVQRMDRSDWVGIEADGAQLRLTDGRPASLIASEGPRNLAVFDWPLSADTGTALAWAPAVQCSAAWAQTAPLWLRALGFNPQRVADVPGLVVARTVATLVNEAAEAVREGVCSAEATDLALVLGAGAPAGPFAWLSHWGAAAVLAVLAALDDADRGGRHRASALLRERAWTDVPVVRPLSVLPS